MKPLDMVKAAAVALPLAFGGTAANADVVTIGQSFNFSWDFTDPALSGNHITGTGTISTSLSGSDLVLEVTLTNTSMSDPPDFFPVLYSFGFGINPEATSVSFSDDPDGGLVGAELNEGNPQGPDTIPSLDGIEVCAFADSHCSGGGIDGDAGIDPDNDSDTFTLTLGGTWGTAGVDTVTIEPIGFKFQGEPASFEFFASSSSGLASSSSGTPEPGSAALSLLGLGLLGAGFGLRRRSQRP